MTRPSALVVAVKTRALGDSVLGGLCRVNVMGREAAGRPSVVSRMWHVIGGLEAGVDIVGEVGEMWFLTALRRVWGAFAGEVEVVGMRLMDVRSELGCRDWKLNWQAGDG